MNSCTWFNKKRKKNKANMKLSIIVASYNEKPYLKEAIESCLSQKFYAPYEIIIGDDGSDDGSIDVIKDYACKYPEKIQYFIMDREDATDIIPAFRASNVVKKAFTIATGEYLMVMSGDDLLCDKEKCRKQIEFLDRSYKYSSCYTDFKKFWDDGTETPIVSPLNGNNSIFWGVQYVHISCFIFKREVLNNLLNQYCDDTGLCFSILKTGKSKHLSGVMFGYRQRSGSIMHKADWLELNIAELLLFQDVRNGGGYWLSTCSRFSRPLMYVFKHREQLKNEKYRKYLNNGKKYPNDYLDKIVNYQNMNTMEKLKFRLFLFESSIIGTGFRTIYKIVRVKNICMKIINKI